MLDYYFNHPFGKGCGGKKLNIVIRNLKRNQMAFFVDFYLL